MIFRTGGGCKSGKPDLALHNREQLILVRSNKLVAASVDVDNLYLVIILQMLAQLGDIHVHRPCIEVVVVNPDGLQGIVALQYLIGMSTQQSQQLVLLRCELGLLLTDCEQLLLCVESEAADMVYCILAALLALYPAQDGLDAQYHGLVM